MKSLANILQVKGMPGNYWLLTDEKSRAEYENDKFVKKNFTPGFFYLFIMWKKRRDYNG